MFKRNPCFFCGKKQKTAQLEMGITSSNHHHILFACNDCYLEYEQARENDPVAGFNDPHFFCFVSYFKANKAKNPAINTCRNQTFLFF